MPELIKLTREQKTLGHSGRVINQDELHELVSSQNINSLVLSTMVESMRNTLIDNILTKFDLVKKVKMKKAETETEQEPEVETEKTTETVEKPKAKSKVKPKAKEKAKAKVKSTSSRRPNAAASKKSAVKPGMFEDSDNKDKDGDKASDFGDDL